DSLKLSTTTYEMTDAQQSLRTAQEYINRDLVNTGDGLNSINRILVPQAFVTSYLALNPVTDPTTPGIINLPLLTSDNDVAANTSVFGSNPATNVRANPVLTDRISMLEIDPNFTPIARPADAINAAGTTITIAPADAGRFSAGEVYFLNSSLAANFCDTH